jgi:hypothetical protein
MNAYQSKLATTAVLFLLIFLSGFWISRSGKPYPMLVFTLHKLTGLGVLIFLALKFFQSRQIAPLTTLQIGIAAFAALCFITMIVTGGLSSVDKAMPDAIRKVHQIIPYLTVASAGISLYLL